MGLLASPDQIDLLKNQVRCDETLGSPGALGGGGVRASRFGGSVTSALLALRGRLVLGAFFTRALRAFSGRLVLGGLFTRALRAFSGILVLGGLFTRALRAFSGRLVLGGLFTRALRVRPAVGPLGFFCNVRSEEIQFRPVGVGQRRTSRLSQDSMTINVNGYGASS